MKKIFALVLSLLMALPAAADETLSSGLTLVIPSQGARNWGTTFKNSFAQKISEHDHTGSGKGLNISTNAIAANAVTAAKIRLTNDAYLRARNAANSADIDIVKVSAADKIRFSSGNVSTDTRADLGLAIGTNVQAYDADLTAYAGVTPTAAGLALLDDASAAAQRSTLTAAKSGANTDITSIYQSTSDGSDNAAIDLGHVDSSRGAGINLFGNEHATQAGILQLRAGSSSIISFATGISTTLTYDGTDLTPVSDDTIELGDATHTYENLWVKQRTWVPTLNAPGGEVTPTTGFARYQRIGKQVFFQTAFAMGSTLASAYLEATVPSTAASIGGDQGGGCRCRVNTVNEACSWTVTAGSNQLLIYRYDGSDFTSGVALTVWCNGFYEES